MIRVKAVLIKLKYLHFSDRELFDTAAASFRPEKFVCPFCGAVGQCHPIRPYSRMLISVSPDNQRIEQEVLVPRVLCDSCATSGHAHTQAILPDVAVPYGSYSLRFILTILNGYLNRSCSITDFCAYWQIAVSTLYGWIHLFIDHYSAWCNVLDRIIRLTQQAIDAVSCQPAFPSQFFGRFAMSFLQGRSAAATRPRPVAPGG